MTPIRSFLPGQLSTHWEHAAVPEAWCAWTPKSAQWESGGCSLFARNACTGAFDVLHRAVMPVNLLILTSLEMMPALRARLPKTKENSLTWASPADTIHLMYWLLRGKMRDKTSTANTNCKNGLSHHYSRPKADKITLINQNLDGKHQWLPLFLVRNQVGKCRHVK